jgi:virulence-associated protein VapD
MFPSAVLHRQTQDGDFDRLNELFQGASITIPNDFEISERVALIQLTLYVDNIRCYNVSVGDMVVDHSVSNTNIDVTVDISGMDLTCDVDYRYEYGLLHGSGVAQVFTKNNVISTTVSFLSDDYATLSPSSSSVQNCSTDIRIYNIDFHDDFLSDIVQWFEKCIKDLVELEIEAIA